MDLNRAKPDYPRGPINAGGYTRYSVEAFTVTNVAATGFLAISRSSFDDAEGTTHPAKTLLSGQMKITLAVSYQNTDGQTVKTLRRVFFLNIVKG